MNFKIILKDKELEFEDLGEAIGTISNHIKTWNNFEDTNIPFTIVLEKKQPAEDTLGIHITDEMNLLDKFVG